MEQQPEFTYDEQLNKIVKVNKEINRFFKYDADKLVKAMHEAKRIENQISSLTSTFGNGGGSGGGTGAPDANESIATGGQRNTTINIQLGNMVGEMNFNGNLNDNKQEIKDGLKEILAEIFGMAETAV